MQFSGTWGKIILLLGVSGLLAGGVKVGINYIWPSLHPGQNVPTVYDKAGILSGDQATFIQSYHGKLLQDHDIDYRVMSVRTGAGYDTNRLAHRTFNEQSIGDLSATGRALLLLVDTGQNKVRLEVSAALEGVYTDGFVSYIQHRQMIPFFRTGRVADGILATTEMIFTRAQQVQAGDEFTQPMVSKSAGGGAVNPAQIGHGEDRTFRQGPDVRVAAGDPHKTLDAYRQAMDDRNGNPNLSIYTQETQAMLANWTVTPAQMDNAAKNLKICQPDSPAVSGTHAVIRFPVQLRQCPPYFLKAEDGAWKLDLAMMQQAIRFNHRNQWHFDLKHKPTENPYGFAFSDWHFDKFGFPHE